MKEKYGSWLQKITKGVIETICSFSSPSILSNYGVNNGLSGGISKFVFAVIRADNGAALN